MANKKEEVNLTKDITNNVISNTIYNIVNSAVNKIVPQIEKDIDIELSNYLQSDKYIQFIRETLHERVIEKCCNDIDEGAYDDEIQSIFTKKERDMYISFIGNIFKGLLEENKTQKEIKKALYSHYIENLDDFCTLTSLFESFLAKNEVQLVVIGPKEKKERYKR